MLSCVLTLRRLPARALCPGENPLAFLRNQPQFVHMRQAIQQNPNLLSALLQQLGQENPQLLQVSQEFSSRSSCWCPAADLVRAWARVRVWVLFRLKTSASQSCCVSVFFFFF